MASSSHEWRGVGTLRAATISSTWRSIGAGTRSFSGTVARISPFVGDEPPLRMRASTSNLLFRAGLRVTAMLVSPLTEGVKHERVEAAHFRDGLLITTAVHFDHTQALRRCIRESLARAQRRIDEAQKCVFPQ